jgi:hypothetical protein
MEAGKAQGELDADLDVDAAAVLFIGTIQGLVMQSLLAGKVSRIRRDAPAVFAIYLRGIERTHDEAPSILPPPSRSPQARLRPPNPSFKSGATHMTAHSERAIWMRVHNAASP